MTTLSRILSLWFVLVLLMPGAQAQNLSEAVSMYEGIAATGDSAEVVALYTWANEHRASHYDEAKRAAQRALALAQELGDQRGIGWSLSTLGELTLAFDLNQAETYYTEARTIFEQIDDERGLLYTRIGMGYIHVITGHADLEQAYKAHFDALQGLERLGDTEGQVQALNIIGNINEGQGNLDEALMYYKRAVALAETLNRPDILTYSLSNLGMMLTRHELYESAETHLRRALTIAEERAYPYYAAGISNNLGFLFNRQGHYERAVPFLLTAEHLSSELKLDGILFAVYNEFAIAYMGLAEYDRALNYAHEALAREQGTSQRTIAHRTLSRIYEAAGDPVQALAHYQQYATGRDSVLTLERAEIIAQLQIRYEMQERQQAIERLEQEKRIQSLQQTLLLVGVGGLLLLLGILFNRYRHKQRSHRLLEELDAAKSRFFANISHEFRTPLTVILGGSQDIASGRLGTVPEKVTTQLQAILRNSRRLQHLINEVLDLNRLESGQLELRPTPNDLVRSLRDLIEIHASLAERNGITLTLTCEVESCPRLYDAEKLNKIIGNLLSNALKFTPRGGSVSVVLRCKTYVEISVVDDGPGIPAEAHEKVFERFAQLDHDMLYGGTGIGLALARELTELHGGTLSLESTTGKGSTFIVRLPLEKTVLTAVQVLRRHTEEREAGGDGYGHPLSQLKDEPERDDDRITVLIIEDNDDVRSYVRRSLEETYRVVEASDGEGGLQQARDALPDLIVSDVMLPDVDGYEIARRLKATPDTACIPVVMLTARAAESDHVAGYDSGAETYITKPFSPETLRAAIARLIEERLRLRRQLQADARQIEKNRRQDSSPTLVDRARAVVIENLHEEDFGIEELASALAMSRAGLYSNLRTETGLTPATLIRTVRLEKAAELLAAGAGSVSEVAYAVGFKSRSHFTRTFREYYGVPPLSVMDTQ